MLAAQSERQYVNEELWETLNNFVNPTPEEAAKSDAKTHDMITYKELKMYLDVQMPRQYKEKDVKHIMSTQIDGWQKPEPERKGYSKARTPLRAFPEHTGYPGRTRSYWLRVTEKELPTDNVIHMRDRKLTQGFVATEAPTTESTQGDIDDKR